MDIRNEQHKQTIIGHLKSLVQSEGWSILVKELKNNVKNIEQNVLNISDKSNEIKYTAHDLKRFERINILWLIDKPKNLINELQWPIGTENID